MSIIGNRKEQSEILEMLEVPLLYGSLSDQSLTSPEEEINQPRRAGRLTFQTFISVAS